MCHNFSPQDTKERDDDKNTELDEQGLPTRRHTTSLTLDPETGKQVFKIEKTTELLFKTYGKDEEERTKFDNQLREVQSHVTSSLKKTDQKVGKMAKKIEQMQVQMDSIHSILKLLKSKVG